ncbi:MAG: cyclic nucleotide-binding domain-containing protein, partial [Parvimonas micra]|nr:cyclic nucleotide-binding domain-containing protein [Parvimonas micra]
MKKRDINLQNLQIFSDLSTEEIDVFKDELNIMRYKKNTFLFKPGDKADTMYIIASGKIKVFTISSSGIEQMLYIYQKDDFIGGLNLIKKTAYIYYGQAIEDTLVISLSRECFDKIINKYPKVTIKILEESFLRIRHAEDLVTRLIE